MKYFYSIIAFLTILCCNAQVSLNQAEYFWDTDPGEGNGTTLVAIDGNLDSAFERLSKIGIVAPSVGNHKFSIRIKDNTGVWGPAFTNMVVVEQTLSPTPIILSQAEYFWDTDPGEGNGTTILAIDGNFDNTFEQLKKTGIAAPSVGNHKFSIRIKDNTGVWGPAFTNMVIVEQTLLPTPISLSQAEYFWDTDLGEGSGTTILAVNGNFDETFEQLTKTGIATPSVGNHKFSIRIKDNTGVWGPTFTNTVIVEQTLSPTPISLSQAEYFWDADPGEGNGTTILAVNGNFDNTFEQLSKTGIAAPSVGNHKFSIRIKDNTGVWGPAFTNMVIVEQTLSPTPVSLSQAEYFWDTDPGEGNGTIILAVNGDFDRTFEQLSKTGIAAPSVGNHKFSIRIKDNTGVWGPAFTNMVIVEQTLSPTPISLSQAEYFWDTDPGEGNGTTILAIDGNFDKTFEQLTKTGIAAPSVGNHKFSIRIKDNTGVWGPAFTNMVIVEQTLSPTPISLSQAEYFWDTDPGEGNGTTILAIDGNFDKTFEQLTKTGIAAPSVGNHKFSIRIKDNTGVWGPAFTNMVIVEQTLSPTPISLSQAEYFWDTDPGEGNGTTILAIDGNFDKTFEQLTKTGIAAPSVGNHKFSIRIKDNIGVWGPAFTNMVIVEQTLSPTPISLSQAEYFWDTDPGEGNGTAILAVDGNFNASFEKVFQNGITIAQPIGLHIFNVRMKDNTGVWGSVFKNAIYIETTLCNTPQPTASTVQNFCNSGTIASLVAIGSNIKWYANNTIMSSLTASTTLASGTYYVSQTIGTCESTRLAVSVTINATTTPSFTQISPICSGESLTDLPTISENGITGTWSPALDNLATTAYTFTPTAGLCATSTTITIVVNPNITPTFTQVSPICSGESLADLPTFSENGITGTWSPALNNLETTTYTFTPTAGLCATSTTMTIVVNPNITPTFRQVAPNCSGENLTDLLLISENGITGTWSPALNNSATTTYTFTPTAGLCATSTTMTIVVNPSITPAFTDVSPICSGESLTDLPTVSENGIAGTWSPALDNSSTTTYTFTPTAGLCATSTTMSIVVNPNITPIFTEVLPICSGESLADLPTISDNEITGTWSPDLDNRVTTAYTFTPTAGLCAISTTMTIVVNPNITPIFTEVLPICSGESLADLPTISENGITGTWSPALDNLATTTYTFTPTAGQCATSTTMTIVVNPNITPIFTEVAPICSGESLADLPTISDNEITGTWSPALDNLSTTVYTFTPTAGLCATSTTMTIVINPNVTPTFTQVAPICSGEILADLPTISDNGITGTWSPALDNLATTTYTFTPTAGLCATSTTMTIVVNTNITPTFSQVAPICSGEILADLPTISENGITGTWSPAIDNIATTTYTFTPTLGLCATSTTMTIVVNPNITPIFTEVAPICSGESLADLPTISENGITGTWSPALDNLATTTYTFTPTAGLCATSTTITIVVNPNVTPTFTQVSPICSGENLADLPTISENGITGTWSPALNNSATTTYTFTPTAGLCATSTTMTIVVNPNITPTFTQVAPICSGEILADLPTISENGITGSWSPALDNLATTTYTFTPTLGLCATSTTMTIVVNPNITPTFTQVAPICSGEILADLPTISENGITGSWSPALDDLATTTYTFTPTAGLCAISTTMTIVVNPNITPIFTEVLPICSGESLADLPTVSENGITGTWSPDLDNSSTTTYTFTPTAGQCATPSMMTITVYHTYPPSTFGQAFCSGATIGNLLAKGNNIQWYSVPTGGMALSAETVLVSGNYYASQTLNGCESDRITSIITINPTVEPTFTQVSPICFGAILVALPTSSLNGVTGTWSPAINNLATTTYTFTPYPGQCATSTTMTIVVRTAGTIAGGNVTVCAASTALNLTGTSTAFTNSTTITLNGNTPGSTVVWQRSVNYVNATNTAAVWSTAYNSSTATNNILITPTSITASNLLSSVWYRAKVTSGTCVLYTDPVAIIVSPVAKTAIVTSATSVCSGGSITFTSAAIAAGSTIAWEVSTTSTTTGFSLVQGENSLVFTMDNIAYAPLSKFYVRTVVTSGACSIARSGVKTITVSPMSIAGTITGGGTFCSGSNKLLKIAGCNGTIQWMYSTDGTNFMNVPKGSAVAPTFATTSATGTASSYLVSNITGTTFFKAVVKSGACSTSETNVVKYTIATSATAGTATAAVSSVCSGTGTTIALVGFKGDITWQKTINPSAVNPTWATISSTVSPILATGNLTVTTAYRARVTIGTCAPIVISNAVLVTINCTTDAKEIDTPTQIAQPFSVVAYPNPYHEGFNLNLTSSSEEKVMVLVYDMIGKLIESREINILNINNTTIGDNYPSGVYNVIVSQNDDLKTLRVIKR